MENNGKISFDEFLSLPQLPTEEMSLDTLRAEVKVWRSIWSWIHPEVQYWVRHCGEPVRLQTRFGKNMDGVLGVATFNLSALDIEWIERYYDYGKKKATYEVKRTTVFTNNLTHFDFIHDKMIREEEYDGRELGEAELQEKSILE